jgi:hypothetical protein
MAVRIPILTSFDPRGLRQANAQLGNLKNSVGSLSRNFALLGVAIAGAGALIAKNAQALARIQRINAQTAQTIKSMGDTAGISAKGIEDLAGSLEALTATEAETIQEGANLLLTFRNIQNQAGEGNDIFNQTAAVMVDLARAMGTSASGEAIRLGKALNDPVKGVAALTRVGVSFTEQQKEQIKALATSGDLLGAQKIILAELQSQFGGSGAAFAQTFTGQLELMGHELGTIGEEATMAVMPALQGMVEELRALIPVIGPQLKAAVESVDFIALGQAVVGFTTFLIRNAEAITKTIAALFIISTAYKTLAVVVGISKVAMALHTWAVAQAAAGMTVATVATNAFSTALRLIPFVAVVAGVFAIGNAYVDTKNKIEKTTPALSSFNKEAVAISTAAAQIDPITKLFQKIAISIFGAIVEAKGLKTALDNIPKNVTTTYTLIRQTAGEVASSFGGTAFDAKNAQFNAGQIISTPLPKTTSGGASGSTGSPLGQLLASSKLNEKAVKQAGKLESAGLSAAVAQWVTSVSKPVVAAREAIKRISNNGQKAINNLTKAYNNSAAGQAAAASAAASSISESFSVAYDDTAAKEAAALAERERVFQSFSDAVKNTFASIKNSILNAFDLTQLGGSTNAITRNMEKLLSKMRTFAANIRNLAGMGLDPALLQQVISAGPIAGANLASALVAGGATALSNLNRGYGEFGDIAGQIATTGTESLFNRPSQQSVYNINVSGGVGSGATIGQAIVDAIKAYERTSGAVWVGA